jgi:hypothetical protein
MGAVLEPAVERGAVERERVRARHKCSDVSALGMWRRAALALRQSSCAGYSLVSLIICVPAAA